MMQIRLSQGLYALVNDEDFEWVNQWKWCASLESRGTKFYAVRRERINGKSVKLRMHVEIVKHRGVHIPPGFVVDHVNHNSLDNRFTNHVADRLSIYGVRYEKQLEVITQAENMRRSIGWKRKKTCA